MRFILVGFGKFGRLAFDRLKTRFSSADFIIVDPILNLDSSLSNERIQLFPGNWGAFLADCHELLDPDLIVPVAPSNIAVTYILVSKPETEPTDLPKEVALNFQNFSFVDRSTMWMSHANFMCPDDCEEEETCAITGTRRTPMFNKIQDISVSGFQTLVIRSSQVLPGVGAYTFHDLRLICESVVPGKNYLIATSCKCHAIMSAIVAPDLPS